MLLKSCSVSAANVLSLAKATCGVMMRFGSFKPNSGLPSRGGFCASESMR
jgi:hypothetical protein